MQYAIRMEIAYDYDHPAAFSRQVLRLLPADLIGEQQVTMAQLTSTPRPEEWFTGTDFFGNRWDEVAYTAPHETLIFKIDARVTRLAPRSFLDVSPRLPDLAREIAGNRSLDPISPHHFLGRSPRIALYPSIAAYARTAATYTATCFEAVRALSEALHRDMTFDANATTADTSALEAFENRHGVCQDFTHVMITGLRSLGIPAGYVSGFLRTVPPKGKPRLEGADAMHAWVRAWCGYEMGWIEIDPTNNMLAGSDHIVIGRGRDYADVAPVRGVMRSSGEHTSRQSVDVVPLF